MLGTTKRHGHDKQNPLLERCKAGVDVACCRRRLPRTSTIEQRTTPTFLKLLEFRISSTPHAARLSRTSPPFCQSTAATCATQRVPPCALWRICGLQRALCAVGRVSRSLWWVEVPPPPPAVWRVPPYRAEKCARGVHSVPRKIKKFKIVLRLLQKCASSAHYSPVHKVLIKHTYFSR